MLKKCIYLSNIYNISFQQNFQKISNFVSKSLYELLHFSY